MPGFVVRTLLGSGAHGEVWAAREQVSGEQVALKVGRSAAGVALGEVGGEAGRSTSSEADLLARLDHPHLVRLRRVVPLPDGGTAMVLDLASGGSLAALVAARGPLDPGEVVTMLVPLATVLAEVHRQGVVHGDLAPGNVLFAADGRPLLADLGVGRVLGERTPRAWSTPGFADPASSRGGDLRAGDVWGLGAVAWFALTGRPPLDVTVAGGEVLDVAALDRVRGLPAELGALVRSCLSLLPAARPGLDTIAERAWASVPPRPIRWPDRSVGGRTGLAAVRPQAPDGSRLAEPGDPRPGAPEDLRRGAPDDLQLSRPVPDQELRPVPDQELRWVTAPSAVRPALAPRSVLAPVTASGRRPSRPGRRHLAAAAIGCLLTGAAVVALYGTSSSHQPSRDGAGEPLAGAQAPAARASITQASMTRAPAGRARDARGPVSGASITRALEQISAARARAFQRVSTEPLAAADEPGSPAERMDAAFVHELADAGLRLDGVSYRVGRVRVLATTRQLVDVSASVTTSSHRQSPMSGGRARTVAAVGPQRVRLRLVRADQPGTGWLVRSVVAVSE